MLFFFNDTATTEIYTLSLHDALPISAGKTCSRMKSQSWALTSSARAERAKSMPGKVSADVTGRSEEHTSELQSRQYLVCRLLLEKKKEHNCIRMTGEEMKNYVVLRLA